MDSTNEVFGIIRHILAQPPSWEHWNQLILYMDTWPDNASTLSRKDLRRYVEMHLQDEWGEQWLVGNEAWPEDSVGWELQKGKKQRIRGLPEGVEIWCPPGQWTRIGAQEPPVQDFELEYGFWIQDAPFTTEDILFLHEEGESFTLPHSLLFTSNHDYRFEMTDTLPDVDWLSAIRLCNLLSKHAGLEPAYELEYIGAEWVETVLNHQEWSSEVERWETMLDLHSLAGMQDGRTAFAWEVRWKGLKTEGYRLPTVAEWEVAVLATSEIYTWNAFDVARKHSNAWGLRGFDNQHREWCWDQWGRWEEDECKHNPCFLPDPRFRSLRCTLRPEETDNAVLFEQNEHNVPLLMQNWPGGALRVCRTDLHSWPKD